ncbi:MAG: VCBS repeat-containing protein [Myxococcota bacterium]
MTANHHPPEIPPRRSPWSTRGAPLASLLLWAGACTGAADDVDPNVATAQDSITAADLNPVVVTSGTCISNGFRPITTASACAQAQATVLPGATNASATGGTEPGCHLRTDGTATAFPLSLEFGEGTPQEINAQACSHDAPCVCHDENTSTSVCDGDAFRPDPNKYYTIRSANGRYLRTVSETHDPGTVLLSHVVGDSEQPYQQPGRATAYDVTTPDSDARLHWRFDRTLDGLAVINRKSGRALTSAPMPSGHHHLTTGTVLRTVKERNDTSASCRGAQVFLDSLAPVDTGGLYTPHNAMHRISLPLVFTAPQSPGFETLQSGCVKKSRSCTSLFGSEYVQTGRNTCGAFGHLHRLRCTKDLEVPISMHVPQGWYIEEVTQYARAVDIDPAPVIIDPLTSPSSMASSLATFGASSFSNIGGAGVAVLTEASGIAAHSSPLYGALFSVGVNAAFDLLPGFGLDTFEQPDPVDELAQQVSATLEQLKIDLTAQTEVLIANGLAQESARELNIRMNVRRRDFYTQYPGLKTSRLALDDQGETRALRTDLLEDVDDLQGDIEVAFPTLGTSPSELDVRRAHFAIDFAKLASMDALIMLSEAILIDAIANPTLSCEDIIEERALPFWADFYADKLTSAVDGLVAYGRAAQSNRVSLDRNEFEFDARNFSYPIQSQLDFFDAIVPDIEAKCQRLRDPNDAFRGHFVANTPVDDVPDVAPCHGDVDGIDTDGSGTCDGALGRLAGPWTASVTAGTEMEIEGPILGDIDGDGDLDVVTRHLGRRRAVSWRNTGGTLTEHIAVATGCRPSAHDLVDLDGDGDLEILAGGTGGSSNRQLIFSENIGASFAGREIIETIEAQSLLAMHVDGDDQPDVVAFDKGSRELLLYLNATDDDGIAFGAAITIDTSVPLDPGLATIDVDADGDRDLVVSGGGRLIVYVNEEGSFAPPLEVDTVDAGDAIAAVYTADLDQDGDEDIITVLSDAVVWYENRSNGDFRGPRTLARGNISPGLALGDVDGDGDTDVVLRNLNNDAVVWVENGRHGLVVRDSIGVAQGALALGDLDGDGDGDVVAADPSTNGLRTLMNPLF